MIHVKFQTAKWCGPSRKRVTCYKKEISRFLYLCTNCFYFCRQNEYCLKNVICENMVRLSLSSNTEFNLSFSLCISLPKQNQENYFSIFLNFKLASRWENLLCLTKKIQKERKWIICIVWNFLSNLLPNIARKKNKKKYYQNKIFVFFVQSSRLFSVLTIQRKKFLQLLRIFTLLSKLAYLFLSLSFSIKTRQTCQQ